jgi:hypothetical protein
LHFPFLFFFFSISICFLAGGRSKVRRPVNPSLSSPSDVPLPFDWPDSSFSALDRSLSPPFRPPRRLLTRTLSEGLPLVRTCTWRRETHPHARSLESPGPWRGSSALHLFLVSVSINPEGSSARHSFHFPFPSSHIPGTSLCKRCVLPPYCVSLLV